MTLWGCLSFSSDVQFKVCLHETYAKYADTGTGNMHLVHTDRYVTTGTDKDSPSKYATRCCKLRGEKKEKSVDLVWGSDAPKHKGAKNKNPFETRQRHDLNAGRAASTVSKKCETSMQGADHIPAPPGGREGGNGMFPGKRVKRWADLAQQNKHAQNVVCQFYSVLYSVLYGLLCRCISRPLTCVCGTE
jgi:hypothetical protein